ncbi:TetR/AcrR family transcriptional regulator [Lacticaseibacillus saniviri]|uniref:HTH tetR-type domain-containing protein n=1 Tax=Lacticaseibacillus saniviri JCM 17471 = DSM 24301 TaxID=1293598 RepID=A0A0R2MRW2_9LACO|nr:TetR/AcrR family transcriptional regulator [Lacticaseibacillus saniviri]KRO16308.1 hypothetical protein IV56_GL001669 [Lacticaseibacillus saniviri JCM 17471 = DSM 24301]MCG4281876.1 TetR/AcrR family transcriptional regulator [Lacticaseibacillus saniviri]
MAQTRKRGDELLADIYAAVIAIMDESGYAAVNFKSVAERAGTNRPVLYRRWNNVFDLVFDAVRARNLDKAGSLLSEPVNTGHLRTDLLQIFQHFLDLSNLMGPEVLRAMVGEIGNADNALINRLKATRDSNLEIINRVLDLARHRGEQINAISDETKLLPFESIRYQIIISQQPLTTDFMINLVDEVMLPILTRQPGVEEHRE